MSMGLRRYQVGTIIQPLGKIVLRGILVLSKMMPAALDSHLHVLEHREAGVLPIQPCPGQVNCYFGAPRCRQLGQLLQCFQAGTVTHSAKGGLLALLLQQYEPYACPVLGALLAQKIPLSSALHLCVGILLNCLEMCGHASVWQCLK